jgi:hypothetical protein
LFQREKFGSQCFPIRALQHRRGGCGTRRERSELTVFRLVQCCGGGRSPLRRASLGDLLRFNPMQLQQLKKAPVWIRCVYASERQPVCFTSSTLYLRNLEGYFSTLHAHTNCSLSSLCENRRRLGGHSNCLPRFSCLDLEASRVVQLHRLRPTLDQSTI